MHVYPESLLTTELLPDTCNRARHKTCTRGRARWLVVLLYSSGPRVRGNLRGHNRCDLHKPAQPAQGQVPGVDARARGWHRPRYLARLARYTRQRGLARAVSRSGPECRGFHEVSQFIWMLLAISMHEN